MAQVTVMSTDTETQTEPQAAPVINTEHYTVEVITLPSLIHYRKFAELVGLSEGVVRGWIDKGLLPTRKIGRYSLIDMEMLKSQGGLS